MDFLPAAETDVAIIGAGPAGLAVGACLRRRGISFEIFERSERVGSAWHRHYRRLHLHTPKGSSGLPYKPFPADYPRYPSRLQVVDYLEDYARSFELHPRFGEKVTVVRPTNGNRWEVITDKTRCVTRVVVIASGLSLERNLPALAGIEAFRGRIIHSTDYIDGEPYRGQNVLVVGFGNSGAEIALDLEEHGAAPAMSIRSPVRIIPRDLLGVPIVTIAKAFNFLPAAVVDFFFRPILRLAVGDLRAHGIKTPGVGPMVQVAESRRVPVLDVGTVKLIKDGKLKIRPGIQSMTGSGVVFADGSSQNFDAIIFATGLRPQFNFLKIEPASAWQRDPRSIPGRETKASPNLYFCGFHVTATGMLREIAIEARTIASCIAAGQSPSGAGPGRAARF